MNLHKIKIILYLALGAMLLHTIEEYVTRLYGVDPFIVSVSQHFSINAIGIYLAIQALVLALIVFLIWLVRQNKFNKPLTFIFGILFVFELIHPYDSIREWNYYPGLYSGMLLVIIGYFYWKEWLKLVKLT